MEVGDQGSGLTVDLRVVLCGGVLDQHTWEVLGHHEFGVDVSVYEPSGMAGPHPWLDPLLVGANLASEVTIGRPARFDNVSRSLTDDLEHTGFDQTPTVVRDDLHIGQPADEQVALGLSQCSEGTSHTRNARGARS